MAISFNDITASTGYGNIGSFFGTEYRHSINLPSTASSGDVVLIAYMVDGVGNAPVAAVPSGWTNIINVGDKEWGNSTSDVHIQLFYKKFVGGEGSTVELDDYDGAGIDRSFIAWTMIIDGVDSQNPIDVVSTEGITGSGLKVDAPSVTSTNSGTLIAFGAQTDDDGDPFSFSNNSFTFTSGGELQVKSGNGISGGWVYSTIGASVTSGATTVTSQTSTGKVAGHLVFKQATTPSVQKAIAKYNGVNAFTLKPNAIDTREMNGFYTSNAILQTNLNYSYDFAHSSCYTGTGTTVTSLVNSYTGTINGSPTFNSTTGAFECDAVNDYILLGRWTRPVNWSAGLWFLSKDWATPASNSTYSIYDTRLDTGGTNGLRLTFRLYANGENEIRFRWVNSGNNQNTSLYESVLGSNYFQEDQWYYLCWSRTGSTNIKIWMSNPSTGNLDELADFTPVAGVTSASMTNNTYGCSDQIGSFFNGDLAELHEYSSNLGLTDFQQNFNNTKARYGY